MSAHAGSGAMRAWSAARGWHRRHRRLVVVTGSLGAAAVIGLVLGGRRDEFAAALSSAPVVVLALAAAFQVVALLARTEAWHGTICAAGGTVDRRVLYRASSMGYVASILNSQVGVAARITALRRSAPTASPGVSTLIAAEFPILAVEATLAALTSFTLVVPLGFRGGCRSSAWPSSRRSVPGYATSRCGPGGSCGRGWRSCAARRRGGA